MVVYLAIVLSLIGRHGISTVGYASLATSMVELAIFLPLTIKRIRSVVTANPSAPSPRLGENLD